MMFQNYIINDIFMEILYSLYNTTFIQTILQKEGLNLT